MAVCVCGECVNVLLTLSFPYLYSLSVLHSLHPPLLPPLCYLHIYHIVCLRFLQIFLQFSIQRVHCNYFKWFFAAAASVEKLQIIP